MSNLYFKIYWQKERRKKRENKKERKKEREREIERGGIIFVTPSSLPLKHHARHRVSPSIPPVGLNMTGRPFLQVLTSIYISGQLLCQSYNNGVFIFILQCFFLVSNNNLRFIGVRIYQMGYIFFKMLLRNNYN